MLEKLADATFVMKGGYRKLTREEIITIFPKRARQGATAIASVIARW